MARRSGVAEGKVDQPRGNAFQADRSHSAGDSGSSYRIYKSGLVRSAGEMQHAAKFYPLDAVYAEGG